MALPHARRIAHDFEARAGALGRTSIELHPSNVHARKKARMNERMLEVPLRNPWLVAVWPGMGGVAQISGSYLVRQLAAQALAELDPRGFFELQSIAVKGGLVQPGELPHSVFYVWRDPRGVRDVLVMLGDRQPNSDGFRYCEALLEIAAKLGVERVFTFAAMATPIHPTAAPRVFAVATRRELLLELTRESITLLTEGEVTGLNGVFLAAAAARDLPAIGLLGEFPFFAAPVPNPKASAAVLRVFSELSGVPLDLTELDLDAARIERDLVRHLEGLQRAAQLTAPPPEAGEEEHETRSAPRAPRRRTLSPQVQERIEALFAQAKLDRSKALELKAELDRRHLFARYENRFLDLFKQGG